MIRFIAAVVAGMFLALLLLVGVELLSAVVHPTPTGFEGTMEEMREHVARYPHWVLAIAAVAWGLTAFTSSWVAHRIGGRGPAIVVGLLLVGGAVFNISILPYTIWFEVVIVPVIVAAIALAIRRTAGKWGRRTGVVSGRLSPAGVGRHGGRGCARLARRDALSGGTR